MLKTQDGDLMFESSVNFIFIPKFLARESERDYGSHSMENKSE